MDFVSEDYCEAHRQDLNGLMQRGGKLFPGFCSSLTDTVHVCSYINRLVHGDTLEAETLKQSNWLSEASAIGVQAKQHCD